MNESMKRAQGLMKNILATTPRRIDPDRLEAGMLTSMALIELRNRAEFTADYRYVLRARLSGLLDAICALDPTSSSPALVLILLCVGY